MKISKNFTLEEFIKSTTAKNKKIDNTPGDTEIFYINKLAEQLQRIRDRYDIFGFPHEAYLRFLSDCYEEFINDVPLKKGAKEAINILTVANDERKKILAYVNEKFSLCRNTNPVESYFLNSMPWSDK